MERMWFYAQGNERKGPVPESEIKAMIAKGAIAGNDLVWTEGMSNWIPLFNVPELNAQASAPTPGATVESVLPMAAQTAAPAPGVELPEGLLGWLSFIGVITLIGGIFNCMMCVGILWGVFQIIAGVALMGAKTALLNMGSVPAGMDTFFQKLRQFAMMSGICIIVKLVITVIGVSIYFAAILALASSLTSGAMHP